MGRILRLVLVAASTLALTGLALPVVDALGGSSRPGEPPWAAPLARVDAAAAVRNADDTLHALQEAYLAALGSRRWDGMVAVGHAAHRVGRILEAPRDYDPMARRAYLIALFRARRARSVEGMVRVAEGFGELGDAGVARQCMGLTRRLLVRTPDGDVEARLEKLEQRLAERSLASGPQHIQPF